MHFLRAGRVSFLVLFAGAMSLSAPSFAEYKQNFIGEMKTHRAVYEDTLIHLARTYDLGFIEMRSANPELDPWIPGEGAEVIVPTMHLLPDAPRQGVVINVPEMRIYVYKKGQEPKTYPIAVGREGLGTPMGKTTITRKAVDPIWRPTPRMRKEDPKLPAEVLPGPENPMGNRALYLGWPQYAIHGTNKPYGIGRRASSGCIRMYPEDITEIYDMLPVGTVINAVNQPIKVEWIGDELYLEAHPDLEQALMMEVQGAVTHKKLSDTDMKTIIAKAGVYEHLLNWAKIRTIVRERTGYPIKIAQVTPSDKKRVAKAAGKLGDNSSASAQNGKSENAAYATKVTAKRQIPSPPKKPEL